MQLVNMMLLHAVVVQEILDRIAPMQADSTVVMMNLTGHLTHQVGAYHLIIFVMDGKTA